MCPSGSSISAGSGADTGVSVEVPCCSSGGSVSGRMGPWGTGAGVGAGGGSGASAGVGAGGGSDAGAGVGSGGGTHHQL